MLFNGVWDFHAKHLLLYIRDAQIQTPCFLERYSELLGMRSLVYDSCLFPKNSFIKFCEAGAKNKCYVQRCTFIIFFLFV